MSDPVLITLIIASALVIALGLLVILAVFGASKQDNQQRYLENSKIEPVIWNSETTRKEK